MTKLHKIALGVSLALLALSAQAFAYSVYVAPQKQTAREISGLVSALRAERASLPPAVAEAEGLRPVALTVPRLLAQVQELAVNLGVDVYTLAPTEPGSGLYRMTMVAGYDNYIRFLARFETLQVEISEMTVTPLEGASNRLTVTLGFRRNSAGATHSFADAAAFEAGLRGEPPRDPFNAWNGVVAWRPQADSADLTWVHHLTGVSEIGESRIATIDDRDYRVGDTLRGRIVTAISQDSVTLTEQTPDGERDYRVSFRYLPDDQG